MSVLVTGAAGFIGFHTVRALVANGETVIGLDNINDYYSLTLKRDRLRILQKLPEFTFHEVDIADMKALNFALRGKSITKIIHLAAQAGVRYSLINPTSYVHSNLIGQANMLEICRRLDGFEHFVFASSSSIYGERENGVSFCETDPTDHPLSLYAATKKSGEMLSYSYANLYHIPMTGLRFFTVYGPWGRPDMAYFSFTKSILEGLPINLFNHGDMLRDFTYIDDIVDGIVRIINASPKIINAPAFKLYNIGNNRPEKLGDFVRWLEEALDKRAVKKYLPMQPGDVPVTCANIDAIHQDHGFKPVTCLREGLKKFVDWYREYYQIKTPA